jgi:hypothetical protein
MAPAGCCCADALPFLLASACEAGLRSEQARSDDRDAIPIEKKNQHLWKLPIPIGVNLLLGIPAIVPLFLVWYLMANWPLADLGWTQREPTENDGILPALIFSVPVFCLFGSIWGLVNMWMRPRTAVPASQYWLSCVAASLVPYFAGFLLF